MLPVLVLPVLALSVGCGYPFDTFNEELAVAACSKYDECNKLDYWGGTYDECLSRYSVLTSTVEDETGEECPNYDNGAAKDCVADWETLTCAQLEDGQTPAACDSVCTAGSGT